MRLIVGLGNPGKKYKKTRHNVGFLVLDQLVNSRKLIVNNLNLTPFRLENQFKAEVTQTGGIGEDRIIFAKPQTFMNLSGEAISKILNYYKIGTDDLIVIADDLDLPLGSLRIRLEGSSGGHNGLQSIVDQLGRKDFVRIKVGIGSNKSVAGKEIPAEDYVLQKFSESEQKIISQSVDKVVEILLKYIKTSEIKEETIIVR